MKKVRLGIIGMGNIGKFHAEYLRAGKIRRCELVAVCSPGADKLETYLPLKIYSSGEELIESGILDAVLISTPHYQHTTLGILALENGLHTIVEKPVSAHKADAEKLIAAATKQKNQRLVFGGMFQLRVEPRYEKIRKLIQGGELGEIARVSWIITDWFRTEAYYASSGWRATWKGEGGGVLLNQCLHNLDILQWLCGMPSRVRGFCQLGRYHNIEVEDNVTAYFEYPNGSTGVFITSTGEAPGTNRLEIAGTRGRLVLENDRLLFTRNEIAMTEFNQNSKSGFLKPEIWNVEIPIDNSPAPHAEILQNFVDAILDGTPLIAPGVDGINSVELANVMLYSSLTGRTMELPMESKAYERKLKQLIASSSLKKTVGKRAADDFSKSFSR